MIYALIDEDNIVIDVKDLNINELREGDLPTSTSGMVGIVDIEVPAIGAKWNGLENKFE
jgi:hypothetical protein